MKKNRTLLFCFFTDIISISTFDIKEYSLDKFFGLILWFQTDNDIVTNHVIKAEKEEEIELGCDKYSITIKRKNLFLEKEFDKFKEHVINSISAYYGVYPGQVIKEFSRSNIILWSSMIEGKLTILIPFKPNDIKPTDNSNMLWSVGYATPVLNLVPPSLGPLCDSNFCCEDALFLIPIPQLNETFYTFGKDGVLIGFKSRDILGMKVSVRKQGCIHELTLKNIVEENTNKPITLKIQIIEPSHHCNIFRTKEEALNSLIL